MKTHERRGPSPGETFATWINSNAVELNARMVAPAFAEWINSGGEEFAEYSGLKKSFLELTELTVDLTRELRQVRGPFGAMRFVGPGAFVGPAYTRGDRKRYATIQRYREKISPILKEIQREKVELQLRDIPGPHGKPVYHEVPEASAVELDRFDTARTASYALKQFHFLNDQDAFANFRRCALTTCRRLFFPRRPERLYCSDACQGKDYMDDPLRKKKNAAYQKVNYYTKKVQELGKLAPLNPRRQEENDHAKKALKLAKAKLKDLKRG